MPAYASTRRSRKPAPAVGAQALDYARSLARRELNPLAAVLGSHASPAAFHQYPDPGINWIGRGLGYFYHSHGPRRGQRAEHGHFHLFARQIERRGKNRERAYAHLLGIEVDARGAPLRLFTTNLWVTAGRWRSAAFIARELRRFARIATRPDSGPERWVGMLLKLFPAQVGDVLRQRELRVARWRREHTTERRLWDHRIHTLSSAQLSLCAGSQS